MPVTKFEVNSDTAKAIREILKVVAAEQKMGAAAGDAAAQTAAAGLKIEGSYKRVAAAQEAAAARGRSAARGSGGGGGAGGGGGSGSGGGRFGDVGRQMWSATVDASRFAAVAGWKMFSDHLEKQKEYGEKLTESADQARPYLSLGDNLKDSKRIREQIRNLSSTSAGVNTDEAFKAAFNLQSSTGNFDEKTRQEILSESIKMNKVGGGELSGQVTLLAKSMQSFGKEIGSVQLMAAKLFQVMDRGAITLPQLAERFPDLAAAAKAMGIGFDEAGSALITATTQLGSVEKVSTGLMALFTRIPEAVEKGIIPAGKLNEQLQAIAKLDPLVVKDAFGQEGFTVAVALAAKWKEARVEMEGLRTVQADLLSKKLSQQWADPATGSATVLKNLVQGTENDKQTRSEDPKRARAAVEQSLALRGAHIVRPDDPDWAVKLHSQVQLGMKGIGSDGDLKAGWLAAMADAKKGKDKNYADYLLLNFKQYGRMQWTDKRNEDHTLGPKDYQNDFLNLRAGGLDIHAEQYQRYRQLREEAIGGSRETSINFLKSIPRLSDGDQEKLPAELREAPPYAGKGMVGQMADQVNTTIDQAKALMDSAMALTKAAARLQSVGDLNAAVLQKISDGMPRTIRSSNSNR